MTPRKGESIESFRERDRNYRRARYAAIRGSLLARNRAKAKVYYYANREKVRDRQNARQVIRLGDQTVNIANLPPELRPVAELIKETRREIMRRGGRAGAY